MLELPFTIKARFTDTDTATFIALVGDQVAASERYRAGNGDRRRKVAALWAGDMRLRNGSTLAAADIEAALLQKESEIIARVDADAAAAQTDTQAASEPKPEQPTQIERASHVDDDLIAELAWSFESGGPDFIVYDRHSHSVKRCDSVPVPGGLLVPPGFAHGVLTPAYPIPGTVYLPSEHDETGVDEDRLRDDLEAYIRTYVEFTDDMTKLAVEYVLMSWVYDAFDELPYLVYKTADAGRGKSRALDAVGMVCYRPIYCGGGSSAAAVLRLLDRIGGSLVADEMDQKDTELASELNKILCQGFQRGRPLVRCAGENNTPKAFACYGPKLFAIRRGFSDDAVQTRCVTVKMRQRTRADIPLSLPRREFDRRALALRNRLLAWRFARLGKIVVNPAHADSRLEDRSNQIGLSLLAVAETPDGRARVVAALLEQQGDVAVERADSLACAVFEAALSIAQTGDTVFVGDVAKKVNATRAEAEGVEVDKLYRPVTPHRVGKILRNELEFVPEKRQSKGIPYRLDPARVTQLQARFAVHPPTSAPNTQVHPHTKCTDENTLFDAENADSVHSEHSALPDGAGDGSTGSVHADPLSLVPDGWAGGRWADRLEQMADGCQDLNPEAAVKHRQRAAAIREALAATHTGGIP